MKKLFCLIAVTGTFLFAQQTFAQKANDNAAAGMQKGRVEVRENENTKKALTPEARAQEWTDHLVKRLSLSDEQRRQAHTINLASAKEVAELKSAGKRDALKAAHKKREVEIVAILTADQKAKFDKLKKQLKDKRGKAQ